MFAIFMNILASKLEFEKMRKYVVDAMLKVMTNNFIRADADTLTGLFVNYIKLERNF